MKFYALLLSLFAASLAEEHGPQIHCGTMQVAARWKTQGTSGLPTARVSASSLPSARSYATNHFVIHYSLAKDVNRVKLVTQDSALKRKVDSILSSLPTSWTTLRRDSAMHAGLTSIKAPHPLYIQRAAIYLERAYAYYVDSLGMDAPSGSNPDKYYNVVSDGTKYTVFIGDINTLESFDGSGPTYALTYPNPDGYMLLENDFLYDALWDNAQNTTSGKAITSSLNNQLLYDYTVEWDLGLKVTVSHEYYHALQYTYTAPSDIHAWYELSAVGMEERLVPESKDYFQYLPYSLGKHEQVSLLVTYPNLLENYGNATFHQYLTKIFGRAFDVKVWAALRSNNNLQAALNTMVQSFGARWDTLYAGYTAAMGMAGRAGSTASCTDTTATIFTRDLRCWPVPTYDTLSQNMSAKTLNVPALTYRFVKPLASGKAGVVTLTNLNTGTQRVLRSGTVYSTTSQSGTDFLLPPSPDSSVVFLSIANASFTQTGKMALSVRSLGFGAYPNPVVTGNSVSFFAPSGTPAGTLLTIISQSGKRVAQLSLTTGSGSGDSWTLNQRDTQNRAVPPGTYFYRMSGQPVKTLLILAH